ncbi:smg-9, partial [Pristionchus pacificus]
QMSERRQVPGRGGGRGRGGDRGRGGWDGERRGIMPRQEEAPRGGRPMQILQRRDADTPAVPTVDLPSDTTSSTSTTTLSSMRTQRGTLDSTGVLAMLTGAAPAPVLRQRDAAPSTAAAAPMQQARPEPRRVEQRRMEKMGSSLPKGQAAAASKEVAYLGGKKVMRDASRVVTESGELSEYLVNTMMNDFLSDTNRDFRVVAAVGPQTVGKSTILSMMAGNQPLDLFRQYVFRPSSREAVEQSKHQSTKVSIYVSKARNIFIDCQPLSCASLLDEQIHTGSSRGSGRMGDRLSLQAEIENLQILAWTLQVSHTVLVCHDWFIDLDIIKQLRTAELLRGATDEISAVTQLPKLSPTRKTNLLFVHTRARPDDFKNANRLDRASMLKKLFGGAMRVRLAELPPQRANWDGEYSLVRPPLEAIYFPLGEMKLREMSTAWQDERSGHNTSAGSAHSAHSRSSAGPMSPGPARTPQQRAREKEKENHRVNEFIAGLSGAVPFDEGIVDLRRVVHLLPRESFTPQGALLLTETQWFRFACGAWRDQTFRAAVSLLESTLAARRKPRVKRENDAMTERMRTMKISDKV